jgi:hypothetical protein
MVVLLGGSMSKNVLKLTDAELSVVYDALEEVRLSGGFIDEESEIIAGAVQDKIFEAQSSKE